MKQAKGFTLLEMLVVLGIVGLLLAIVPISLSGGMDGARIKTAVRELAADLRYARSHAISSQKDQALVLNVESGVYSIDKKKHQLSIPDETSIKIKTASSEQVSDNEGAIRFFADGSSTGGLITIKHTPYEFFIDVNWLTGKVTITP